LRAVPKRVICPDREQVERTLTIRYRARIANEDPSWAKRFQFRPARLRVSPLGLCLLGVPIPPVGAAHKEFQLMITFLHGDRSVCDRPAKGIPVAPLDQS